MLFESYKRRTWSHLKYLMNKKQPTRGVPKKLFWKYAANLQENTDAEVQFQ